MAISKRGKKMPKKAAKKVAKKAAKKPSKKVAKKAKTKATQIKERRLREAEVLLQRMRDAGTFEGVVPVKPSSIASAPTKSKNRTQVLIDGDDVFILKYNKQVQAGSGSSGGPGKIALKSMFAAAGSNVDALKQMVDAGSDVGALQSMFAAAGSDVGALQSIFAAAGSNVGALKNLLAVGSNVGGLKHVFAAGSDVSALQNLFAAASNNGGNGNPSGAVGEDVVVIHIKPGCQIAVYTGAEAKQKARDAVRKFNGQ